MFRIYYLNNNNYYQIINIYLLKKIYTIINLYLQLLFYTVIIIQT